MTPPLNFSGVPQQPQAMPPYGINQPPQRMPQQPMMYQQFGVVPDSFQGQQPMMVSNAPMMRSGRANLALKNQQLQDQIDTLENQPLPAGGNPVGVGALAVGAAGATAVGASEVAYRWGDGGLKSKLASSLKEDPVALAPLTDAEQADITAKNRQAKLDQLQANADIAYHQQHQATIHKIIPNASSVEAAIADQTKHINDLETQGRAEFDAKQKARAYKIVNPGAAEVVGSPHQVDSITNEMELLAKEPVVQPAVALEDVERLLNEKDALKNQIGVKEGSLKTNNRKIADIKREIIVNEIEALEKKALGKKYFNPTWDERNSLRTGSSFTGNIDLPEGQQQYLDFLQERINEKNYLAEFNKGKGKRQQIGVLQLQNNADYDQWKQATSSASSRIEDLITGADKKYKSQLAVLEANVASLNNEVAPLRSQYTVLDDQYNDAHAKNKPYREYEYKQKKLEQLKVLQAEPFTPANATEIAEAKHKLQQLETIQQKKPVIAESELNKKGVKTQLEAEAKKLAQAELDARKANLPEPALKPAMDIKDAEGFGKAWQSVEKLEADGYKTLAEHSKGAKGVGWKAGALVGVIGAGLTLQQFFAAGKAQEANAAKEAKLAQLRQQQADLGG